MPTADELLSRETVAELVGCLERAAPGTSLDALRRCERSLGPLAFGERVTAVSDALLADLPVDLDAFADVLRRALEDDAFAGWMIWAVADAASRRALESAGRGPEPAGRALESAGRGPGDELEDHGPGGVGTGTRVADQPSTRSADGTDGLAVGLELLRLLTPRHSSEAAIRRLLDDDPQRALAIVAGWTTDPDAHVRRLASEGTRPFLPWARRVPGLLATPGATIPILDALYRDPSEYVRRSVANHLNDLSRVDPALVVSTAARWQAAPDEHTPWVVRHALRTLVKKGDPAALAVHGFAPPSDDLVVTGPTLASDVVPEGGELAFAVAVHNAGAADLALAVDYVVHYRKANGTLAPKVFKLTTTTLAPGASASWERTRSFRPITTRRHHPGGHALELQINGRRYGRVDFELLGD